MAENHVSKRRPIARKPRRHRMMKAWSSDFSATPIPLMCCQILWRGLHSATVLVMSNPIAVCNDIEPTVRSQFDAAASSHRSSAICFSRLEI
jgi:hypothetical protein